MYARVVRFTGVDMDEFDRVIGEIEKSEGPPEGVPAKAVKMLADRDGKTTVAITFYDSEEDMKKGDEIFNSMDPPGGTFGERASVDLCEVAIEREAP